MSAGAVRCTSSIHIIKDKSIRRQCITLARLWRRQRRVQSEMNQTKKETTFDLLQEGKTSCFRQDPWEINYIGEIKTVKCKWSDWNDERQNKKDSSLDAEGAWHDSWFKSNIRSGRNISVFMFVSSTFIFLCMQPSWSLSEVT